MKIIFLLLSIATSSVFAQTIDYNLKKGYIANGYDVVAYFNNEALEGDKKFSSQHDGVHYKFSSEKNLNLFIKNPEKYIPEYGGYCAYAIAKKGDKVSINPKTFKVTNGKLYLFYNAWGTNTLELWKKGNENILLKKADETWKKIMFKK
jgi:YHS domain-containing protein